MSQFFTFEPEVHRAIRSRYKDTLRLGVALQLGFLTMCGRTLHPLQRVPAELLKHRGEQMEIPAPDIAILRALYKNRRATLFEHQAWSIEFLGFMHFEMTDAPKILPAIRDVVKAGVNGDPLLASARRLLHEYRFVIPGTRRLGSLVQLAVQSVTSAHSNSVARCIAAGFRSDVAGMVARAAGQFLAEFHRAAVEEGKTIVRSVSRPVFDRHANGGIYTRIR